ncbi:MAG: DUF1641 domain-containing protein [Deltaproteobacteria bacterium]|nr:DUF1641 domain-containing protein [Deltaproteobacteria bacterium]MBW2017824.1 DUF1641 domain-containing protein [Deltaproteobacteria bacterium]MBW2130485.1 DUF1641 domain-containing protein [Deltaproteobacteria bacterium]MBW2303673.1 DUF1641 domain-containing protein [Deltaproteobacteria bacterium]
MNQEALILERLDRIEAKLTPLLEASASMQELKNDLTPLANHAVKSLIEELQEVESSFQLEDLLALGKQLLRSVRHLTYALRQLGNLIDFVTTLEPLLKSSVPQIINYLDDLEQRGVFRILNATLGIRAKIAAEYTPEDIEQIGDGLVALLGFAKKLTDPQAKAFFESMIEVPCSVDLSKAKCVSPIGLLWGGSKKELKDGLGVLLELTKGLGKLKEASSSAATREARRMGE